MEGGAGAKAALLIVANQHELSEAGLLETRQDIASDSDRLTGQGRDPLRQQVGGEWGGFFQV